MDLLSTQNTPEFNRALHEVSEQLRKNLSEALAKPIVILSNGKIEMTSRHMTRKEAATYLKVCLSTLDNYIKQGKIKTSRIGSRVLIKKSDLDSSIN